MLKRTRILSAVLLGSILIGLHARATTSDGYAAPGPLDTKGPVFGGLTVWPAQAAAGKMIALTFSSSEALAQTPEVTVNGNPAGPSAKAGYSFDYIVLPGDSLGPVAVTINGTDLVGNAGSLQVPDALTVIATAPGMPLQSWPMVAALLGAGLIALRRKTARLPLLAILVAPIASAASLSVANVTVVQRPAAMGTEVVITYDLTAPDGPCDITVSLSKNGGLDGFPFPVTAITGAITGVTTGSGHSITWDIATDYPDEDLPDAQLRVTADDGVLLPPGSKLPVEMIPVDGGSFEMGRTSAGDDAAYGVNEELPVHTVTLSPYRIGKYEVTNQQFADVLNWAFDPSRNYLRTSEDAVWSGTGDIYAAGELAIRLTGSNERNIEFSEGVFCSKTRVGTGGVTYSMGTHPVHMISWYGAALFCNWLSELEGLTPVYDPDTAGWPANFANDGYHLPTEAQWERAAAWDGTKHWIYAFTSDTLTGSGRANFVDVSPNLINPLGLTTLPPTSPAGWFDGVNVSPNGNIATTNSVSPVGCYDMSGNVWEMCHDWFENAYYSTSPESDPTGPATGFARSVRGGSWNRRQAECRSARRIGFVGTSSTFGFRIAQ